MCVWCCTQGPVQWPVLLQMPEAAQDICTPIMFICADYDHYFPERTRTAVQQVLEDKLPGACAVAISAIALIALWSVSN